MMVSNKIRIKTMNWENVRNFESLGYNNPSEKEIFKLDDTPYSLLQIQNNYGKTTTMHLLRSIFTGLEIPDDKKAGYRYRKGTADWGGDVNAPSVFSVIFEINGEICEIKTQIDHHTGEQKFFTFREKWKGNKGNGIRDGWNPPKIFKDLFENKESFANLIILDGEKARELNANTGSNVIGTAIKQVTGLERVTDLVDEGANDGRISQIVKDILSKDLGATGSKNKDLEAKLKKVEEHSKWIQEEAEKSKIEKEGLVKQLEENTEALKPFDEDIIANSNKWAKANENAERAKSNLKESTKYTIQSLFNPVNVFDDSIWKEVKEFYNSQIQGKLPKSVSSNWFEEIMDSYETCICGTKWTKEMKNHISENKDDFLEELLMSRVKSLQQTIVRSEKKFSIGEIRSSLDASRDDLKDKEKVARRLKAGLMTKEQMEEYEKLLKEKQNIKLMMSLTDHSIERRLSTNRDFIRANGLHEDTMTSSGVPVIQPHLFQQINNAFELRKVEQHIIDLLLKSSDSYTKSQGAKILQDTLKESTDRLLNEVKQELQVEVNNMAKDMAGLDVSVEITERKLVFRNPAGKIQETVNESGELGAIYGLVSALNKYSDVSLPIIVDTPLAGMGKGMVHSWREVVPETFDQLIALINSTEKDSLKFWWENEYKNKDISLFTFMRRNENVDYGYDNIHGDKPTGKMYITGKYEIFDHYERYRGDVIRREGGE